MAILDRQEPPPELAARVYAGHEDIGNTSHRHLLVAEKPSRVIYIPTDITKPAQVTHSLDLTVEWAKETSFPLGGVLHGAGIALAEMASISDMVPFDKLTTRTLVNQPQWEATFGESLG